MPSLPAPKGVRRSCAPGEALIVEAVDIDGNANGSFGSKADITIKLADRDRGHRLNLPETMLLCSWRGGHSVPERVPKFSPFVNFDLASEPL